MSNIITVATFNFEDGGFVKAQRDYGKLELFGEVIAQVPDVDILFFQEGREYDREGNEALFAAERILLPWICVGSASSTRWG